MYRVALCRSSSEGPSRKPARGPIFSARQTDGSLAIGCWSRDDGRHFVHSFCWCGLPVTACVALTCEKCPPPGECSSFAVHDVWMSRTCRSCFGCTRVLLLFAGCFFPLWSLIRGQQVTHGSLQLKLRVCLQGQIWGFQRSLEDNTERTESWVLLMTPSGSWRWSLNTPDPTSCKSHFPAHPPALSSTYPVPRPLFASYFKTT